MQTGYNWSFVERSVNCTLDKHRFRFNFESRAKFTRLWHMSSYEFIFASLGWPTQAHNFNLFLIWMSVRDFLSVCHHIFSIVFLTRCLQSQALRRSETALSQIFENVPLGFKNNICPNNVSETFYGKEKSYTMFRLQISALQSKTEKRKCAWICIAAFFENAFKSKFNCIYPSYRMVL